ncbi:MAG: hypothetical protein GX222_04415 [Ruminococcaceae bacterium]|nr:hypothetical protein [Oscillospiraceae bacterium]
MSELINYIDPVKVTICILRDWSDKHWKATYGDEKVAEINSQMTSIKGASLDKTPVTGGASRTEEMLCAAIDKKDILLKGREQARAYIEELMPYWERLTEEEQFLLTTRFIERNGERWEDKVTRRYYISRSEAYRRSDAALKRLASLLFW